MRKTLKRLLPDHQTVSANRWLRPFASTLLHPRLWHLNRHSAAGAVAVGMFCGLIPGPFQMLGAALCWALLATSRTLAAIWLTAVAICSVSLACRRPKPLLMSGGKTLSARMYSSLAASSTAFTTVEKK